MAWDSMRDPYHAPEAEQKESSLVPPESIQGVHTLPPETTRGRSNARAGLLTIKRRILRELAKSPATAPELGAILFPRMKLRDGMRRASGHLCNLRTRGILKVIGKIPRDGKKGFKQMANLYALK